MQLPRPSSSSSEDGTFRSNTNINDDNSYSSNPNPFINDRNMAHSAPIPDNPQCLVDVPQDSSEPNSEFEPEFNSEPATTTHSFDNSDPYPQNIVTGPGKTIDNVYSGNGTQCNTFCVDDQSHHNDYYGGSRRGSDGNARVRHGDVSPDINGGRHSHHNPPPMSSNVTHEYNNNGTGDQNINKGSGTQVSNSNTGEGKINNWEGSG
ncbi:hypothetical protein PQX77_021635 [Marasmius sp. AFHP31]|nr:hypothetical protein PQX77_021635 [Marasmius sp. AFHP31]